MSPDPAQDAGLRRDPSGTQTFVLDNLNLEMSDITNVDVVVVVNLGLLVSDSVCVVTRKHLLLPSGSGASTVVTFKFTSIC